MEGGFHLRRDRGRKPKRKICSYCVDKIENVDYKQYEKLKRFVTERSKVLPRRISGNCARHQRQLTKAIKRARIMALMPFSSE